MASNSISGSLAAQAQSGLMQAREDRLLRQVQAPGTSGEDGQIEKSAKEFEAMLLSNWLQQAEQSMASVPGTDDDDDGSSGRDQMMSLGVQSLGTSLASSGGIGIASMIAKALHSAEDKGKPAADPITSAGAEKVTK
jgi:Rod binding domain-containing protein